MGDVKDYTVSLNRSAYLSLEEKFAKSASNLEATTEMLTIEKLKNTVISIQSQLTKANELIGRLEVIFKLIAEDNIYVGESGWRDEHFLDVKQANEALEEIAKWRDGK